MSLTFIGVGSAFNGRLGNCSAFLDYGKNKILFDCGELVFHTLKQADKLSGDFHIFISHNHPDHCGSLGSLIFYLYFVNKSKPIIYGNTDLQTILTLQGVRPELYFFVDINSKPVFEFPKSGFEPDNYLITLLILGLLSLTYIPMLHALHLMLL